MIRYLTRIDRVAILVSGLAFSAGIHDPEKTVPALFFSSLAFPSSWFGDSGHS